MNNKWRTKLIQNNVWIPDVFYFGFVVFPTKLY